jgi:hypothetical protein
MRARRGVVLAVVLVCGLLVAAIVVAFQFVSASDYRGSGRLMRSLQAAALADVASDEVFVNLGSLKYGPGDDKPQWVTDLLTELNKKKGSANPIDVKVTVTLPAAQLPMTYAAPFRS